MCIRDRSMALFEGFGGFQPGDAHERHGKDAQRCLLYTSDVYKRQAFMLLNPATPVGRMVASAPPQTMTSASPNVMMRQASPRLWLEVAQAVTMDMFGPPRPYSMEMRPCLLYTSRCV